MSNFIYDYYQQIQSGEVTVGEWVRRWYGIVVTGISAKRWQYSAKKANRAIRFIETFCRHSEGRSDLIVLELWQKALVAVLFGILDDTGRRQFREAFVVIGRKNGKTLLAAAIACYMAILDGEYGARVYFVAPKLEQAQICFNDLVEMVRKDPELRELVKKRRADLYVAETNTTAKPLAFNARKSDGLNPHLAVCDENASWPGLNGLRQYEVMKSAAGARSQPLVLSITTAGYEDEGIYDELFKRSTAVLLGTSAETRLAPFLYTIDDPARWNDIDELQKSNPNLGVSITVDYLLEEIAIAEKSLTKRAEVLTKYCNVKQNSTTAWLDAATVAKACGDPLRLADYCDRYAVCGIDLSQTTDLTAVVTVIEDGGRLRTFAHFWLPAAKLADATARDGIPYEVYIRRGFLSLSGENFVDYHDVFAYMRRLVEEYRIYPLVTGYDRYSAQYLVQDLQACGYVMDSVYQGENLTPVIMEAEGLLKNGDIDIGDNDLLKIHFLNSALKHNAEGNRQRLVKVRNSPAVHIDGMAALLCSLCVRQKWHDEYGEQLKNNT